MWPARTTLRWAALVAGSVATGLLLQAAALPAAFLLGPLLVGIVFACSGRRLRLPPWTVVGAQGIIGCTIAKAITAPIVADVAANWRVMLAVVGFTVLASAAVGWTLARFGDLPAATAAWGSSPGAASAMVVACEEYGADPRLVAFMQYLRVLLVVMTASVVSRILLGDVAPHAVRAATADRLGIPPLVALLETLAIAIGGTWMGRLSRLPAGGLLGPMLVGAPLHASGLVDITLPWWLTDAAYIVIGWYVGLVFTRETVRYALRALPHVSLATAMLIMVCGVSAWVLVGAVHTDPLTAYLATSPGGIDSVTIIALGSGADVPLVLAMQAMRVVVVIVTARPIARLIARFAQASYSSPRA